VANEVRKFSFIFSALLFFSRVRSDVQYSLIFSDLSNVKSLMTNLLSACIRFLCISRRTGLESDDFSFIFSLSMYTTRSEVAGFFVLKRNLYKNSTVLVYQNCKLECNANISLLL